MQTLTEKVFCLSPPGGLFDETVIRNFWPDRSEAARKVLVYRAVTAGEIIRLTPGLFLLAPEYRKSHPHPFAIAAMLHSPSHISLESALAHYGLIPEAVYHVSSVTSARSRTFNTPIGIFSFDRVPAALPRAGVQAYKIDGRSWIFIASPLRAIADVIYMRKEVGWDHDGSAFLMESMRIERDDLENMSFESLDEICAGLRDRRTTEYLRGLSKEFRK